MVYRAVSIECRITMTSNYSGQSERGRTRASESRITIGSGFTSEWMKKWCDFFLKGLSHG